MGRFLVLSACLFVALSVSAQTRRRTSTCLFHIQMTHALPPGTITEVRVAAVGTTKIVSVNGYAWSVQPSYPSSATLVPPSTGPENLSMISVEIDSSAATAAQQIDIQWRGGKPRKTLCHRVLDVHCGRSGGVPVDKNAGGNVTFARVALPSPNGSLVDCRLVSAEVVDEGPIEDDEGDCDPSFDVKDLGCATYQFRNTTEYDVIGNPAQYKWTVARQDENGGDDALIALPNATAENQTITFPGPGTYIVSLEAFGTPCGNDSDVITEEIVVPDLATDFSVSHLPTTAFAIRLQNQSSSEAQGFSWEFNDNSGPSTAPSPDHAFPSPGDYNVCLTASSAGGCQMQNCKLVHISSDCEVDFKWTYTACLTPTGVNGYDVDFQNTSAASGTGVNYEWNFGDNSPPTPWVGVTITHHYPSAGTYNVTLTMVGATCPAKEQQVTVHSCAADFRPEVCKDGKVFVTAIPPSPGATWAFPGGKPPDGSGTDSSTKYKQPGTHTITLTSEDEAHCKCEISHDVVTESLCCKKNQHIPHAERVEQFDYDGHTYRVRLHFAVHNMLGVHWVRVKMVVKRKAKYRFKRFRADSASIQWGGTVYRKDGRCACSVAETASDSVGPVSAKKVKKNTPMGGPFWARLESLAATYKVKIDSNHGGESWVRKLSKPCS